MTTPDAPANTPHVPDPGQGGILFGGRAAAGGFTMMEIVASIVVLSVTSVALTGAMSTGYLGYHVLEKDMTALNLATAQMESTIAITYNPLAVTSPTISPIPPTPGLPADYEVIVSVGAAGTRPID